MAAEWYYLSDGRQHGPVSAGDLKQLVRRGTLRPSDLVWKEGAAERRPAAQIKGLFGSTDTPAPSSGIPALPPSTAVPFSGTAEPTGGLTSAKVRFAIGGIAGAVAMALCAGCGGLLLLLSIAGSLDPRGVFATRSAKSLRGDLAALQGEWRDTSDGWDRKLEISGDRIVSNVSYTGDDPHLKKVFGDEERYVESFVVDDAVQPPRITIRGTGDKHWVHQGIYRLEGNTLTICYINVADGTKDAWAKDVTDEFFDRGYPRDFYDTRTDKTLVFRLPKKNPADLLPVTLVTTHYRREQ